jgi:hypothetical protein
MTKMSYIGSKFYIVDALNYTQILLYNCFYYLFLILFL